MLNARFQVSKSPASCLSTCCDLLRRFRFLLVSVYSSGRRALHGYSATVAIIPMNIHNSTTFSPEGDFSFFEDVHPPTSPPRRQGAILIPVAASSRRSGGFPNPHGVSWQWALLLPGFMTTTVFGNHEAIQTRLKFCCYGKSRRKGLFAPLGQMYLS